MTLQKFNSSSGFILYLNLLKVGLPTCSRSPCEKQLSGCFAILPWGETLRPWPGTDTEGVGSLYSNVDYTPEATASGASLSTPWHQAMVKDNECQMWMIPHAGREFIIFRSDTRWASWAAYQFGTSYKKWDLFMVWFVFKVWNYFKHYNENIRWGPSHFYDKISSALATLICQYCTYHSRLPHWNFYGIHSVCFWRKVFYWNVFNMAVKIKYH